MSDSEKPTSTTGCYTWDKALGNVPTEAVDIVTHGLKWLESSLAASTAGAGAVTPTDTKKQPSTESKNVPWDPVDPGFISATDAVSFVGKVDSDFDHRKLNRVLQEDGPMRYMQNPDKRDKGPGSVQCKVCRDDLNIWRDGLKRSAIAKGQQPRGNPMLTKSGSDHFEKGFADGLQDGYESGYEDVKQRRPYSGEPTFMDDPTDKYVHGQYEGWKKGYAKGRKDSQRGSVQEYGASSPW